MKRQLSRVAIAALATLMLAGCALLDKLRAEESTLRNYETKWQECEFRSGTRALGDKATVMQYVQEQTAKDPALGYKPIAAEDVPYFLEAYNAVLPVSNFEADEIFVITRGSSVWMHFVKNDCVYAVQRFSAPQWASYLRDVYKLKPGGKPAPNKSGLTKAGQPV